MHYDRQGGRLAYPLDIERVLDAVRAKAPVSESVEDVYRLAVPLVNDSFEDGLRGRPFMLQNAEAEIIAYQELLYRGWFHHLLYMTAVHLWQNGTLQSIERR